MRFAFIKQHRGNWPLRVICRILQVSRSGFYAWRNHSMSQREKRSSDLLEKIKAVHQHSRLTYGSPRVTAQLKDQGIGVCENTVARLMRRAGIQARIKRRFIPRTTDSGHGYPIAANRLEREVTGDAANRQW